MDISAGYYLASIGCKESKANTGITSIVLCNGER
nr:MAG TPA: hypothetical protein [Caudoviricetes sp.]